jgi:hypothetical protein
MVVDDMSDNDGDVGGGVGKEGQEDEGEAYYGPQYESSDEGDEPQSSYLNVGAHLNTRSIWVESELMSMSIKRSTEPESKEFLFVGNLSRKAPAQPVRHRCLQRCVEAYVQVNGHTARALLDSGSNTDIIAGDFVQAIGLETFRLEGPTNLQMACVGSKTKLQHGTYLDLEGSRVSERRYFDIANVEGYDMILGTPFLHENGITLHFDGTKAYARICGGNVLPSNNPTDEDLVIAMVNAVVDPHSQSLSD